jgi:hypothetical protein
MPELPGHPDADQLRHQARDLLRAAADGEPSALARLHVVSPRVTLSAAHLALAREYGFPSWPALRAEAERRRSAGLSDAFEDRWSFGGASTIETTAGVLHPVGLIAGSGHAALDITLMPPGESMDEMFPESLLSRSARIAARSALMARRDAVTSEVTISDGRGTSYMLGTVGNSRFGEEELRHGPRLIGMRMGLDPVPPRECGWVELRGRDGSSTRLMPSARQAVRVSQVAQEPGSPAERKLSGQALGVIRDLLRGESQEALAKTCSAALAMSAEMRQSGELGTTSEVPSQLARLCASLTGHRPLAGVPRGWASMISAAEQGDGAPHHVDIATGLPRVERAAVLRVDSLISDPRSWRVHLRARPNWGAYCEERGRKWDDIVVHAEDDLGGMYLAAFNGAAGDGRGHGDYEAFVLRFLPRLDPLAHALKLTFSATGKQVTLELRLQ